MMKYDMLKLYRDYLEAARSSATARTYYIQLDCLLKDQYVIDKNRLDISKVIEKLSEIKYKNYFSKSKNAFLHFCEFQNIKLSDKDLETIRLLEKNTRKKYRKLETVEFKEVKKKINHIKNEKLKTSYLTLLSTGLRVSELAKITPKNCIVDDEKITFHFIGKGGNKEQATLNIHEYPKLYENVKEKIKKTSQEKKLFYSEIYLQTKAKKLGFQCHDLRRAYAKLEFYHIFV